MEAADLPTPQNQIRANPTNNRNCDFVTMVGLTNDERCLIRNVRAGVPKELWKCFQINEQITNNAEVKMVQTVSLYLVFCNLCGIALTYTCS